MAWLAEQLSEKSNRKFILGCHVYSGARYNSKQMWNDKSMKVYFSLIEEFRHKILIELAGHDHFTSLRTHKINE